MNEKASRNKLLAAVLAMALIAVCGVVIFSDSTAYAEESEATAEITVDGTEATVFSAEQFRTVLANEGNTYDSVTTIVIGAPFTVDHVIQVTKSITIDGNDQTITAVKSVNFTGEYQERVGDANKIISINNTSDVIIKNLTIDNAGFSFGLNVYNSTNVDVSYVTSNNSAGAGFVFGDNSEVTATNISATGYSWGGINADKGATVKIDTIDNIGSIYTENTSGTTIITNIDGETLASTVEIGIGTSGSVGYYNGYYTTLNEAAAAYATNVGVEVATIEVFADTSIDFPFEVKSKTIMTIAEGAAVDNNSKMTINGTISGTVNNTNGSVSVGDNATVEALTISGGTLDAPTDKMPAVTDGTVVSVDGLSYSAFTVTRNGYDVTIGIGSVAYSGQDYAGPFYEVSANVLKVVGPNVGDNAPTTQGSFIIINDAFIYDDENNAIENNGVYGTVIDAGEYYILIQGSVSIPGVTNFNISQVTGFTVTPMVISDVKVVGNEEGGSISDQLYNDGQPVDVIAGEDFIVTATVNGVKDTVIDPSEYTYACSNNTAVGQATVTVTLDGNYTTEGAITGNYQIVQELESLDVTANTETIFYVGQEFDITDFTVVGVYEDGTETSGASNPDSENITVTANSEEITVFTQEGTVTLAFTYTVGDMSVTGTCDVEVTGIKTVEVTGNFLKEYDAGDSFNPDKMTVTVTYDDEANIVFNYTGGAWTIVTETGAGTITTGMSTDITIEPSVFNTEVGNVDVTVTYYTDNAVIPVTVNGYITTYMVGETTYGTQVGNYGDLAAIFNYFGESPEGQQFSGWMVGETGVIYQPGDAYSFGEDTEMWTDGTVTFYAQFGGDAETPVDTASDVTIGINVLDNGINVFISGVDGAVPSGQIVVNYTYTDLNGYQQSGSKPVPYTAEGGKFDMFFVDLSEISGILLVNAQFTVNGLALDETGFMFF